METASIDLLHLLSPLQDRFLWYVVDEFPVQIYTVEDVLPVKSEHCVVHILMNNKLQASSNIFIFIFLCKNQIMEIIILHSTTSLPFEIRFREALSKGYITSFKCFNSYVIINRLLVPLCPDEIHKFAKKVFIFRTKVCEGPKFSWNTNFHGRSDSNFIKQVE